MIVAKIHIPRSWTNGYLAIIALIAVSAWPASGLCAVQQPAVGARQETIAVLDFSWSGAGDLSAGLPELLELDLQEQGLDLLERRQIRFILSERRLSRSGLVRPEEAIHQALPWVHYLLKGHVEAQTNSRFSLRISLADAFNGRVIAEVQAQEQYPAGLVSAVHGLAVQLARQIMPGAATAAIRRPAAMGVSMIPEVVLRFYQALDFLFAGKAEVAAPLFREAARLDASFMAARVWEAKSYQALGLADHARLIHEIVRQAYPAIKPLAQQELRAGIGARTVAVVSTNGGSDLETKLTAQLVNTLAATQGLRVFRSDWIAGLTAEMDLQFSQEFASASGLADRSWLCVDLIVHLRVLRNQGGDNVRIDIVRAVTGELLGRIEQPVTDVAPAARQARLDQAVKRTRQICLDNRPALQATPDPAARDARETDLAFLQRQLMGEALCDFSKFLLHYSQKRNDKLGILRLFMQYSAASYGEWNKDGQSDFLHQILLLRQILASLDVKDRSAPIWLSSVLWHERGVRLMHAVGRQGERDRFDQARRLLDFVDRIWLPPQPFVYEPLHVDELIRQYDRQTAENTPLGSAFSLLTRLYPRSCAAVLTTYSLAIDCLNRGDHPRAYQLLRDLAANLARMEDPGLPGGQGAILSESYWINLYYFLALEASRLGQHAQARADAGHALEWLAKYDTKATRRWPKEFGGKPPVPVLGTMAMSYLASWDGKLELEFPQGGAIPDSGFEPFRPRLESGVIAPPHYDLRLDLDRLGVKMNLRSGLDAPVPALAQGAAIATPEQVQAEVQKLCGCQVATAQAGRPYWGYIARGMREARSKNTSKEAIGHLQTLGRQYLQMLSPQVWDYRLATTLVLLATQDYGALQVQATTWLAASERKVRLAGIIAMGRAHLYENGPPALSDFFYIEKPIRATSGRRRQADFYNGELKRWLVDFMHGKKWSADDLFYDLVRRTALAYRLAGMPLRALQVYESVLGRDVAEDEQAPVGHAAHDAIIQSLRFQRATLLEELGDIASAVAIYKLLVQEEQKRDHPLIEEQDGLGPENLSKTKIFDAAVAKLDSMRNAAAKVSAAKG